MAGAPGVRPLSRAPRRDRSPGASGGRGRGSRAPGARAGDPGRTAGLPSAPGSAVGAKAGAARAPSAPRGSRGPAAGKGGSRAGCAAPPSPRLRRGTEDRWQSGGLPGRKRRLVPLRAGATPGERPAPGLRVRAAPAPLPAAAAVRCRGRAARAVPARWPRARRGSLRADCVSGEKAPSGSAASAGPAPPASSPAPAEGQGLGCGLLWGLRTPPSVLAWEPGQGHHPESSRRGPRVQGWDPGVQANGVQ